MPISAGTGSAWWVDAVVTASSLIGEAGTTGVGGLPTNMGSRDTAAAPSPIRSASDVVIASRD